MKAKLLFTLITVVMGLTACGASTPKTQENSPDVFLEDTLAHEELFDKVETKVFRNTDPTPVSPVPTDESEPIIGIQYKDVVEEDVTYRSIRFVAAVNVNSALDEIYWNRHMFTDEGNSFKTYHSNPLLCTKAYETIYDANDQELSIASFASGYNRFVTYTMRHIRITGENNYSGYYLNVSLTVRGTSYNKVVSTTIDQSRQVAFDSSKSGYILGGTFNGGYGSVLADNPTRSTGNTASFTSHFKKNDSFLLIQNNANNATPYFKTFPNTILDSETLFTKTDGKIKTSAEGDYTLFLSAETGKLYPTTDTFFYAGNKNSWAAEPQDGYRFVYDAGTKTYTLSLSVDAGETFGIRCTGFNYWAQNKNLWYNCGYTFNNGNISITDAGTYTIRLYQEDSINPIGLERTDSVSEITPRPTGSNIYIRGGSPFSWGTVGHNNELSISSQPGYLYEIKNVSISEATQFKLGSYDNWVQEWGYWGYKSYGDYSYPDYYFTGTAKEAYCFDEGEGNDDKNIYCRTTGTYDIYITDEYKLVIDIHVS